MKLTLSQALCLAVLLALGSLPMTAQSVISARSGLIHYVEGEAFLADKLVELKVGNYPEIPENALFRTGEGRAEVLLNPGAFLRMGENTSIRMFSNRLTDTRFEFISGSAVIESDDLMPEKGVTADKSNRLTITHNGVTVELRKNGLYRFDSSPAQLRVYAGEAEVKAGSNIFVVKAGKLLPLSETAVAMEKFDSKVGDSLYRWAKRRSEYLAMANLSAAKYVRDNGYTWRRSGWFYNPYFGMFTFIPWNGIYRSPYGFFFYAPREVYRIYEPPSRVGSGLGTGYDSGLGYRTMGTTSSGYSGTVASSSGSASVAAPSTAASGAASAPVSRSGAGGGRDR